MGELGHYSLISATWVRPCKPRPRKLVAGTTVSSEIFAPIGATTSTPTTPIASKLDENQWIKVLEQVLCPGGLVSERHEECMGRTLMV
ncbi:hypothetical protein Hamer_G007676 [Homarus americanus]|uniref:Uncharacterized protein n=1 Tax=Homarus americanus TaxID=6706 RepID=A0A8J5JMD6_HOMAM|nr:hypothetical protein Hamer_G007676 [Homarus americanus]